MTKHTPGPWVVRPFDLKYYDVFQILAGPEGDRFAFAELISGVSDAEANARLIAAAPDLLLALINLEHGVDLPAASPSLADIRAAARAAIAKATGHE